jgi:hypothetical protein
MRTALIDSLGSLLVVSAITLPVGCVEVPTRPVDLQPAVAVFGQYAMSATKPAPTGVCSNCGTKVPPGGGWLGDGTVKVPCPECNPKSAKWAGK